MPSVTIPPVRAFARVEADKAHALKPLEEEGLLQLPAVPAECRHNAHIGFAVDHVRASGFCEPEERVPQMVQTERYKSPLSGCREEWSGGGEEDHGQFGEPRD